MSKTIRREIMAALTVNEGVLATSTGSTMPRSITFEVSDFILEDPKRWMRGDEDGWSEPVQFRFDQQDDGTWDLCFRQIP